MNFCILDIFLAVVTSATEIGNTRPSGIHTESVARIHEVNFYSLTSPLWDDLSGSAENLGPDDTVNYAHTQQNTTQVFEHPCMPLTKILSSGSFYYALDSYWDLSSRLAARLVRDSTAASDIGTFDSRFVWNEFIIRSLLDFRDRLDATEREDFDICQFLVRHMLDFSRDLSTNSYQILAIQGYVGVFSMALPAPPTDGAPTIATLSLISRLGWKRAGTRFNTRGVDDDGNCANFVEVGC